MPLKAVRGTVLMDACQFSQGSLEGGGGLWLSPCSRTPITVSLVELRGSARMIFADFTFFTDKLANAIHR